MEFLAQGKPPGLNKKPKRATIVCSVGMCEMTGVSEKGVKFSTLK
jgi:hypothetical protein